jgi:glucoamylase
MSSSIPRDDGEAFGWPGMPPKWTSSSKDGVGTAYSTSSRVWFTLSHGIVNEIYFPTIDRPQVRDLQFLITDGETFFHEERRNLTTEIEYIDFHTLGYRIKSADPEGRYHLIKEVISDPHQPCVIIHAQIETAPEWARRLRVYALLAPHLEVGGLGNSGRRQISAGQNILTAWKGRTYLALGAREGFDRTSCGYVGASDGWQDLKDNYNLDWEFSRAENGNIALIGELKKTNKLEFTVGVAFGDGLHAATTTLTQSLSIPFDTHRKKYIDQWHRVGCEIQTLDRHSGDQGRLYRISHSLLLAHEDKTFAGALIASASIPWGDAKGDEDLGGYHLVWTRDMVNSVTALLACGDTETPRRALVYLACSQRTDGGFPQNFWIDGTPYWGGIQLDEVAFPIMLAWRLWKADALSEFDPYPMVKAAAQFLIMQGPTTQQDRWEENSGYSPSTLAATIAALTCAADFARSKRDFDTGTFLEEYADFLESHVEAWTVTTQGSLVPGIARHYLRIHPTDANNPIPNHNPNLGMLAVRNRAPGEQWEFPAKDVVDAGFLELVRYGIRKPGDTLIEDSLRVIDATLKVDTPCGPCWRRYNHDGFGQRPDGGPFEGWGQGRAWPLLTGERGHYELAAGRDVSPYIRAMECFASRGGMLPEQVWDEADRSDIGMYLGRPTGSAMPLMWAHAEYIKLLRSASDGQVFDSIPLVTARYSAGRGRKDLEVWKANHQVGHVAPGRTLRILASVPFHLHWTIDEWNSAQDTPAHSAGIGIHFVDIATPQQRSAPVRFTFRWTEDGRWEGRDCEVKVG